MNGRKLVLVLGLIFTVLITIVAFYALILGASAKVNLVGAAAAASVAVAGIVWFKKTVDSHK